MSEKRPSAFLAPFSGGLFSCGQQAERILACNAQTAAYGLTLTPEQAAMLVQSRNEALRQSGRVEIGEGILAPLIRAFCDSPFLSADDYAETLKELTALFYAFKNETEDRLGDAALIAYMKEAFDGPCGGSLELLAGNGLEALQKRLGRPASGWDWEGARTDD